MKRFLTVLVMLTAIFSLTVSAVCAPGMTPQDILNINSPVPLTKLYSADGRTILVNSEKTDPYLSSGWYAAPVTTIYAADNTTALVYASEVDDYLSVGWYTAPVTRIYARNNATAVVYTSEVDNYLALGWYLSPDDVPKHDKVVALTFDDGPSKHTARILDCLDRYGAKATFFVVGSSVNRFPDVLRRAQASGMEIGNHTMNHPKLTSLSASKISSELSSTANAVENITGVRPSLVRPPYGSYTKSTLNAANQPFILWSIDTLDWKSRNADAVVNAALKNVKDGDIILMHDLYESTAAATERIVPALDSRGFEMVTVSELAKRKGKTLTVSAYNSFK